RLDALHRGITEFIGGLSFAPLDSSPPKAILEVGSGSGAWSALAIDAARQFPQARVTAIDVNPIPQRELPSNLEFRHVDVTQPLPFDKESFDVVHARLVLLHVPDGEGVLRRIVDVVKPGGWLLIEEPDDYHMTDGGKPLGPGIGAFLSGWMKVLKSRGADPGFGCHVEEIIRSTDKFDEVNVKKVVIPISGKSDDPKLKGLGLTWKENMIRVGQDLPERWAAFGITKEVGQQYLEELLDPSRDISTHLYFAYCRKRA
ncbi:S-adenosyl-L-methionine-dependent methyltransferase, partial [Trametes sanguinea]